MSAPALPATAEPAKWRAFLRARFTREGTAGLYVTVGFFACAAVAVLFAVLADSVFDVHGKTAFDREVTEAIELEHTPGLTRIALAVTFLGDHRFLLPATLAVTATLVLVKHRVSAILFFGVVIGGWLLESLIKIVYHRARPDLWPALVTEKTFSFPSGHATMSTLFYGAVAALVLHLSKNRTVRAATLALATFVVLCICYSRIYLGAHWATDVVAGILVGLFWVSVCSTGVEYFARRRIRKPAK
ncbi:MAG TPA: phosphatase PAP2 family protein [Thermoanaerobaculia bacterium]|jgi:undecaprenyl-diphosphatase|nr:phosphatase PAP2 family protein [Thermoanaerobaculia bacterium]